MQEKIVTPNFLGKLFGSIDRLAVVEQHLIIDQGHSEQRILKYSTGLSARNHMSPVAPVRVTRRWSSQGVFAR